MSEWVFTLFHITMHLLHLAYGLSLHCMFAVRQIKQQSVATCHLVCGYLAKTFFSVVSPL